ncbi:hypothetical protein ABT150_35440 [Streptomyces mirabilis]|uniref:hypothetical protein n=1 Tax=Streptomyces mirabilis TaxID=68239 RepID=UPI0033226B8B
MGALDSTIVRTAGVRLNPALAHFGLPLRPRGHVNTLLTLQVGGLDPVWAAGDNAQVPDLAAEGVPAQEPGRGVGLGPHKGVAILFNRIKLKSRPAWWFHRFTAAAVCRR